MRYTIDPVIWLHLVTIYGVTWSCPVICMFYYVLAMGRGSKRVKGNPWSSARDPGEGEWLEEAWEKAQKPNQAGGVDQDHAFAWSRTRKGGWAVAQSPILNTTITLSRLKRKGYDRCFPITSIRNLQSNKPPSTWPVSGVVCEAHWRSPGRQPPT